MTSTAARMAINTANDPPIIATGDDLCVIDGSESFMSEVLVEKGEAAVWVVPGLDDGVMFKLEDAPANLAL